MSTEAWPSGKLISEALFKQSGEVQDARRLVCALYLLLRECLPFASIEVARQAARTVEWPAQVANMNADAIQTVRDRAARLHDYPTPRLHGFMHALALSEAHWRHIDGSTPLRDDVQTLFSNGWVASYARHVADELLS